MIKSDEAKNGAKVKILAKRISSRFKKAGFEIGGIGFIKAIPGEPWENNSDLIWITKDKEGKSKSFGFRPEELELIK